MRKQTAPQIRKRRRTAAHKQTGLIAQGGTAQQSAAAASVLDNHSHRTKRA